MRVKNNNASTVCHYGKTSTNVSHICILQYDTFTNVTTCLRMFTVIKVHSNYKIHSRCVVLCDIMKVHIAESYQNVWSIVTLAAVNKPKDFRYLRIVTNTTQASRVQDILIHI